MSNNGENLFAKAERNYRNALIEYIKASGINFNDFDKISLPELRQFALNIYSLENEYQQTTDMVSEFNEEIHHLSDENIYGDIAILVEGNQGNAYSRVPYKGKIGKVFQGK